MAVSRRPRSAGNALTEHPYRIRVARPTDLAVIAEMERGIFTDPWPQQGFRDLLGPFSYVVVDAQNGILAYLFARHVADQSEILNIAVRSTHRRAGLGRHLLAHALEELRAAGSCRVVLEVRASNTAGQRFYAGAGFRTLGRRPGYYNHPREDALIMGAEMTRASGPA